MDVVLVQASVADPGLEPRPNSGSFVELHRRGVCLPSIEIAHHADLGGARSPNGKETPRGGVVLTEMGTEAVVKPGMRSLPEQIGILLAERRHGF